MVENQKSDYLLQDLNISKIFDSINFKIVFTINKDKCHYNFLCEKTLFYQISELVRSRVPNKN